MSYRKIKDTFSSDKGKKIKVIAKVIKNLAETGLAIYNIVIAVNNESVCSKFKSFTTNSGGQCTVQNICTYWADQSLNTSSIQSNNCFLSSQQGYVQLDSIYDSSASIIMIGIQVAVGLILVFDYCLQSARRRLRFYLLFTQLFLTYFNVMALYLITNIDCGGTCAIIANSDRFNESLYYASVPFASVVFFIIFFISKYCCDSGNSNGSCLSCFMILAALSGIVGVNISNAYLLYQDYSIAGFEIPFKIMIVFLELTSFYSIYQIYITKKEGDI